MVWAAPTIRSWYRTSLKPRGIPIDGFLHACHEQSEFPTLRRDCPLRLGPSQNTASELHLTIEWRYNRKRRADFQLCSPNFYQRSANNWSSTQHGILIPKLHRLTFHLASDRSAVLETNWIFIKNNYTKWYGNRVFLMELVKHNMEMP